VRLYFSSASKALMGLASASDYFDTLVVDLHLQPINLNEAH
jgi:hypothetical protein